jgi:hypothetical protein
MIVSILVKLAPLILKSSRDEGLVKDEAKLLEKIEKTNKNNHYDLSNSIMDDGNMIDNHLNDIRVNTNNLSKILGDKLKEYSKLLAKPYIKKEDKQKNLANITDTLQNAKIYLNKR